MLGGGVPTAEADAPANVIEALSKSARVLIVHGSDDMIVPARTRARWRNAFQSRIGGDAGRRTHAARRRPAFLDAVTAFLAEVRRYAH